MTAKKRNPQDTTLRNVRAEKKRQIMLEARVMNLEQAIHKLRTINQRFTHVENTLYELFSGFEAAQKVNKGKR